MRIRLSKPTFRIVVASLAVLLFMTFYYNLSRTSSKIVHNKPSAPKEPYFPRLISIHSPNNCSLTKRDYRIRIMCLVMTTFKRHHSRAKAVKQTWGKKCDSLVFVSDSEDKFLSEAKSFSNYSDYDHLWVKTYNSFSWAYEYHLHDFDWFFKADDDTFVIMENLRHYLSHKFNGNDSVCTGWEWTLNADGLRYLSGGAGYVISKQALFDLITKSFRSPIRRRCPPPEDALQYPVEDINMGICLQEANVAIIDGLDDEGKHLFHTERYGRLVPYSTELSWKRVNISQKLISFHRVYEEKMILVNHRIYSNIKKTTVDSSWSTFSIADDLGEAFNTL